MAVGIERAAAFDLVVEAIWEDRERKRELFAALDRVAPPGAIFTSNSSSMLPSTLCPGAGRAPRFAGLHFFYPAKLRGVVELILPAACAGETAAALRGFLARVGRRPLELSEEGAFLLNRLLLPAQAQAWLLHEREGWGIDAVDALVRGRVFPSGVFELLDSIGVDVVLPSVREYTARMDGRARPFYLPWIGAMERLAAAGELGAKTGAGFYVYEGKRRRAAGVNPRLAAREGAAAGAAGDEGGLLLALWVNEACRFVERGLAAAAAIDWGVRESMGADAGPFALAAREGRGRLRAVLLDRWRWTGEEAYRPSYMLR